MGSKKGDEKIEITRNWFMIYLTIALHIGIMLPDVYTALVMALG